MLSLQWFWILLLLPAPWLLRTLLPAYEPAQSVLRVPFFRPLLAAVDTAAESPQRELRERMHSRSQKLSAALAWLAWLALLLAAARPMWFGEPVPVSASGRDILLAVDLSDSMRIEDMQTDGRYRTRMETVKQVASDFIERREGDRVGLLVFGQRSYLLSPLTFDRKSVAVQLREAMPGFAGSSTAIGDALGMAITLLRERDASARVLVLLTDGANTAGSDPLAAMDIAAEAGIRVHSIGVGAEVLEKTDVTGARQRIDPSKDLDESTLRQIAGVTGGEYFRARNAADMVSIYREVDSLEPAPVVSIERPQRSLFHWPLLVTLLCWGLLLLLRWNQVR